MRVEENDSEWIELKNNWHALCSKKNKEANAQDFVTQTVKVMTMCYKSKKKLVMGVNYEDSFYL